MMRASLLALVLIPAIVHAEGSLYLSPARGSYAIGEVFSVHVLADTAGAVVNAAEAELTFNPQALVVESLSTEGSILATFSTEPTFSNETGDIRFSGWTWEPYAGSDGLLLTINFRTLRAMTSNANLVAGAVLALDRGSNIITSMRSGLYAAEPVQITPVADDIVGEPPPQGASPLVVPTIEPVLPITVGERFVVHGTASPHQRIWIRVVGPSLEGESAVMSEGDGSFTYISGAVATDGLYRITAASESGGVRSEPSERVVAEARPANLAVRAIAAAGSLTPVVPYALVLIVAGVALGVYLHRRSLSRRFDHAH